jgi:hypothetical protein
VQWSVNYTSRSEVNIGASVENTLAALERELDDFIERRVGWCMSAKEERDYVART